MLDRPEKHIVEDMVAQAARIWGAERAAELRSEIERVAEAVSLVARHRIDLWDEEPDFLVAPAVEGEVD